MSLILEALRKMEQDRKNRQGASTGIRAEVLRYRASVQPQQAKPYRLVAICLVLLAAGIGAGAFMKGKRDVVVSQAEQPTAALSSVAAPALTEPPPDAPALNTPPAAALPASVALPATVTVAAPVVTAPAPAGALPAAKNAMPTNRPAASPIPAEFTAAKPARRSAAAEARAARAEADAKPQSKAVRRESAGDVQPVMTEITISGIAFQDERNLRRAVLNGALVGEGAEVAGARVVEIRENKVRMSRGGQLFDVVFSSGFQSR